MVQKLKTVFDKCVMKVAMVRKGTNLTKKVVLIRWKLLNLSVDFHS
jgi:hypothetical protein